MLLSFGSTTRHHFLYYRRRFEAAAFSGTVFRTGEVQGRRIEPQSEWLRQPRRFPPEYHRRRASRTPLIPLNLERTSIIDGCCAIPPAPSASTVAVGVIAVSALMNVLAGSTSARRMPHAWSVSGYINSQSVVARGVTEQKSLWVPEVFPVLPISYIALQA